MRYNTVELIRQSSPVTIDGPVWAPGSWHFAAPNSPIGHVRVLPDGSETKRKVKPTSEVSWRTVKEKHLIKMTPYSVVNEREEFYRVALRNQAGFFDRPVFVGWYNDQKQLRVDPITSLTTEWLTYYQESDFQLPRYTSFEGVLDEIKEAKIDVMSDVVNDSFSGFDLLTELAEFPETLKYILGVLKKAVRPLQAVKDLIKEYQRRKPSKPFRAHSDLMSKWMEYRYAIMPLVYSIQDAFKLLDEISAPFKTDRSRKLITPPLPDIPKEDCIYDVVTGSVTVRAVGKASYLDPSTRLADLININPFLTAWELVPLSFVIDWFINIGDLILSVTGPLRDLSSQRCFCLSVKTELEIKRYVKFENKFGHTWKQHRDFDGYQQRDDIDYTGVEYINDLLYHKFVKNYERTLFSPGDITFKYDPSMSWKRWIDAYVLSFNIFLPKLKQLRS